MSESGGDPSLLIDIEARTDVGCVREANEDSFSVIDEPGPELLQARGRMVLVADGMGGALGGETASSIVTHVVPEAYFYQAPELSIAEALESAVQMANAEVFAQAGDRIDLRGMGSTCTAAILHADALWYAHVGDSRLYLIRGDMIEQVTADHSKVARLVAEKLIAPEDVASHPERSVLLRSIGPRATVEVDVSPEPLPLRAGDRLLLCSDGLTGHLANDEIRDLILRDAPSKAVSALIDLAKSRGGDDNITVAVISIRDPARRVPTTLEAPRAEVPTTDREPAGETAVASGGAASSAPGRWPLRLVGLSLFLLLLGLLAWGVWGGKDRTARQVKGTSIDALPADMSVPARSRSGTATGATDSSSVADTDDTVPDGAAADSTVGAAVAIDGGTQPVKSWLPEPARARAVSYLLGNLGQWQTRCPDFEKLMRAALEERLQHPVGGSGTIQEQAAGLVDAIAEFQHRYMKDPAGRRMKIDGMPGQETQTALLGGFSCPDGGEPRK